MVIDKEAAEKAIQTIADGIGIEPMEAAEGIIKIVNESMFGALRLVSLSKGLIQEILHWLVSAEQVLHANALGIYRTHFSNYSARTWRSLCLW